MKVRLFTLFIIILSVFPAFAQNELPMIDTWEIPLPEGFALIDLTLNPDGTTALIRASNFPDGSLSLWDLQTREKITDFAIESDDSWLDAQFSPDGSTLFMLSFSKVGSLWDAHTGERMHTLEDSITRFDFNPDGTKFAYGTSTGVLNIVDVMRGEIIASTNTVEPLANIRYHPTEDKVGMLSGPTDYLYSVSLWDITTDEIILVDAGTEEWGAYHLSFLPDGSAITWTGTTTRYTYDLTDSSYPKTTTVDLSTPRAHQGYYRLSVSFSRSETQSLAYVYPIPDAQTLYARWEGGAPGIFMAFSPDERFVVSLWRGEFAVWDTMTGENLLSIVVNTSTEALFTSDGKQLWLWSGREASVKIYALPEAES